MRFFSRFGKEKTVRQESKTFTIAELTEFLNEENKKVREELLAELGSIYDRIKETGERLKEEADKVNAVQPDPAMHKPLAQTLKNSKKSYVEGITHNIDLIFDLSLNNYEDCVEASRRFISCINTIHKLEKTYLRFVKFGFSKEVEELRNNLQNLSLASNEFLDKIKGANEGIKKNEEVLEMLSRYGELRNAMVPLDTNLPLRQKNIEKLKVAVKKKEDALQALYTSKEKVTYEGLEKGLMEIQTKQEDIGRNVLHIIGQLTRPLRKYKRSVEGLEKKELMDYIELCIANSREIIHEGPHLNELLKKLKDALEKGTIQLDDKEKEKALISIEHGLKDNLDALIKQHAERDGQRKAKKNDLVNSEYSKRKKELEAEISELRGKISEDEKRFGVDEIKLEKTRKEFSEVGEAISESEYNVSLGA
ncbi:MAG: hypothetical protein ABIG20_01560 [archaeon]